MRAVFDHSWRLLAEREREAFQGLSVFRSGFTREAGEAVTGASLRELMALVNKSLLQRTPAGRYEVHELLRQYVGEKLDQSRDAAEAVRDRHSAFYTAALERWAADLKGARQGTALAEMRADQENARAAWDWAVERGHVERLDQAVEGLAWYYDRSLRFQEGEAACRAAAEKLTATPPGDGPVASQRGAKDLRVLARILTWQGSFIMAMGDLEPAGQLLRQSLALLDSSELADHDTRAERAYALRVMGIKAEESGAREEERRLYEQSLALYRALGDRWGTARVLTGLGIHAFYEGNYSEAQQFAEESLALYRALGDQSGIAGALTWLGMIASAQGQLEEAERLMREGIAIRQEIGVRGALGTGLVGLGWILCLLGRFSEAHASCQEALALCEDTGLQTLLGWVLIELGAAKLHQGQYEAARTQLQKSITQAREVGRRWQIGDALRLLGIVALAEEAYAEARGWFQQSLAVYREIGEQGELSWALAAAAYAARGLRDLRQAWAHLNEALQTAAEIGNFARSCTRYPRWPCSWPTKVRWNGRWNSTPWRRATRTSPTRAGLKMSQGSTSPRLPLPCRRTWSRRRRNGARPATCGTPRRSWWMIRPDRSIETCQVYGVNTTVQRKGPTERRAPTLPTATILASSLHLESSEAGASPRAPPF
jgi:tetratricopeptide (TPR) repeat protein